MIRTINNIIRTLLFQAKLPPIYWVKALHMATHLLNILPSTSINNDIPFQKLFNKPPPYTQLRVFGCLCYPNLHTTHKLEPRSTPCVFLGYPTNHRGYRCLDLKTKKIIISRHVTFDETIFPFCDKPIPKPPTYTFLDDEYIYQPIPSHLQSTHTTPADNQTIPETQTIPENQTILETQTTPPETTDDPHLLAL